jgi:hypothetical protein
MRTFPVIFEESQRVVSGEQEIPAQSLKEAIAKANELAAVHGTFLDYAATSTLYGIDVSSLGNPEERN